MIFISHQSVFFRHLHWYTNFVVHCTFVTLLFVMDVEKLIVLVRDCVEIYDSKNYKHRNKDFIRQVWRNIAAKLHTTDTEAKSKWQNLRSNYLREKRKLNGITPGFATEDIKIRWPYFPLMSFLDDNIKHRKSTGNVPEMDAEEISQQARNDFDSTTSEIYYNPSDESPTLPNVPSKCECDKAVKMSSTLTKRKKKIHLEENDVDKMYLTYLEKMSSASRDQNDPDLMFLKSLLPDIKQLDPLEKLDFKCEVMQLLKRKLITLPVAKQCSESSDKTFEDHTIEPTGPDPEWEDRLGPPIIK